MKKLILMLAGMAVLISSLAAPAVAAKTKATTLYLHGKAPVQEAYINEMWVDSIWMTMDGTEPTKPEPASMFVTNYVRGPNTDCDGNGLLPVWKGDFAANFKGTAKVTLHTIATPATSMVVSLYRDPTGTCTSNLPTGASTAPKPVAQTELEVPAGAGVTEIVFKKLKFKSVSSLALQLHIPNMTPGQVRVLFDSADFPSSLQLLPN
jgi:hypothetical protein